MMGIKKFLLLINILPEALKYGFERHENDYWEFIYRRLISNKIRPLKKRKYLINFLLYTAIKRNESKNICRLLNAYFNEIVWKKYNYHQFNAVYESAIWHSNSDISDKLLELTAKHNSNWLDKHKSRWTALYRLRFDKNYRPNNVSIVDAEYIPIMGLYFRGYIAQLNHDYEEAANIYSQCISILPPDSVQLDEVINNVSQIREIAEKKGI